MLLGDRMINDDKAVMVAKKLGIEFNKFSIEDFVTGLNIELEHGLKNPETNVTSNDLEMTAKIALAHLNEFSDYYNDEYGLPAFERLLESKNGQ
jgi:hypothetical protein